VWRDPCGGKITQSNALLQRETRGGRGGAAAVGGLTLAGSAVNLFGQLALLR
jgi:hypothetical protein